MHLEFKQKRFDLKLYRYQVYTCRGPKEKLFSLQKKLGSLQSGQDVLKLFIFLLFLGSLQTH